MTEQIEQMIVRPSALWPAPTSLLLLAVIYGKRSRACGLKETAVSKKSAATLSLVQGPQPAPSVSPFLLRRLISRKGHHLPCRRQGELLKSPHLQLKVHPSARPFKCLRYSLSSCISMFLLPVHPLLRQHRFDPAVSCSLRMHQGR